MTTRVVIIGAGVAGLAAAWSARKAGETVTLVDAGVGATMLASGAVDDVPWETVVRASAALGETARSSKLDAEVTAFANALDLWDLRVDTSALIATVAGRLRPARGRDRALLDFEGLRDARVALPRANRPGWDADALAATLGADPAARARLLTFLPIDAPVLRFEEEHRIADAELAARHDEPARIEWLAERMRPLLERAGARAMLLGPWLGAKASRAGALSERLGMPAGEALIGTGSPAGRRFEEARTRLLAKLEVTPMVGRVRAIRGGENFRIELENGSAPLQADRVVIASGGMVGGGLKFAPPEHEAQGDLPAHLAIPFALSFDAEVAIGVHGRLGLTSSLHGPELDTTAWPMGNRPGLLEAIGIVCEGVRAAPCISVAGDAIADRARTLLEAVLSGVQAGRATASATRARHESAESREAVKTH